MTAQTPPIEPLAIDGDEITIIDQTLLPGEERRIVITSVEEMWEAIRSLRVRGAAIDERVEHSGEWGFFRLLDAGTARALPAERGISVAFRVETQGVDVVIDIRPARTTNPFGVGSTGHPFQIFRAAGANAPRTIAAGGTCPE